MDKELVVKANPFLFFYLGIGLKTLLAFFIIIIIPYSILLILSPSSNMKDLLFFALTGTLLSLLISIKVFRDTKRPIKVLLKGMERFSRGELDIRVNIETKDEFELLGNGLNFMIEAVRKRELRLQNYNHLSQILISTLDPNELLQRVLNYFLEVTNSQAGCIHVFDDTDLTLKPIAWSGLDKNFFKKLRYGEGLPWQSGYFKDFVFLRSQLKERITVEGGTRQLDLKELIYFPILYKERLYGVISIGNIDGYPSNEINVYHYLVNQIAIALDNALIHKELEALSIIDSLTRLYNRRYIMKRLEEEFREATRYNYPLSIIIFDVDNFKSINDIYGHLYGDDILKGIAELIQEGLRASDIVGRYGGEEFLIILPHTSNSGAMMVGEKLRQMVKEKRFEKLENLSVTISLGLCTMDGSKKDIKGVQQLIEIADNCLYKAKKRGKDQLITFNFHC